MSRELTLEDLRKRPDELIAAIDKGEAITITRNGSSVATLNPVARGYRGTPYPFRNFDFGPRPKILDLDPADLILEERERERSGKKYGL